MVAGRVLIVHAHDGSRIACAVLAAESAPALLATGGFVPYYTYGGELAVAGHVGPLVTVGTTQTFSYALTGLDPACAGPSGPRFDAANSCGIHMHEGTSCADDAGHHYFTGAVTEDPWTAIAYTTDEAGAAAGTVSVNTGAVARGRVAR